MPPETIFESLAEQAKDAFAIRALGREPLSYAHLCDQIRDTLRMLAGVGIGRNDRVAIVLPNGPEMATACLAVAAGATCVPLNPEYKQEEFDYFLPALRVKLLLVQAGMASPARGVALRLGIPILELRGLPRAEAGRFDLGLAKGDSVAPRELAPARGGLAQPEDIALVLHTSGTTARPKIVPLSQANLIASAANLCASLELTAADRVLDMMPLFHIGGLVDLLLAPLSVGASSICSANFSVREFVACVESFDPTVYQGVPTMLQEILAAADREYDTGTEAGADSGDRQTVRRAVRGSSLRLVRSVSAALPSAVRVDFEREFGVPILEIYGMTEASGLIASNPLPPRVRKPGSVGVAAGPEITVLDEAGVPVAAGERGEVAIRGASVMAGYEAEPGDAAELRARTFAGSWMRTGDEGYLDADGTLFLTGRIKEIINRGGEKISPKEVDELLAAHPAVAEAATFAIPHASLGEDVAVAVVRKPGAALSKQQVIDFLRPRLAYFKVPRTVHFLTEIPKTRGGKLVRTQLATRLAELAAPEVEAALLELRAEADAGETAAKPESLVARTVATMWARALGVQTIGVRDSFFDLGGDSLKAATFVNQLQAEWGEIVYVSALFDAPTIAEFETYLAANCPQLVIKMLGHSVHPVEREPASRVDAARLAEFRAAIVPLAGAGLRAPRQPKNPTAIFILSTPRSGSTLLRVMLGGSTRLFAPAELFLLPFDDLAARAAWLARSQPSLGEGNLRAWMQLTGQGLPEVQREFRTLEDMRLPTKAYYKMLQERAGGRILVDKTPFNAVHPESLRRAEEDFDHPLYIHLLRHPYGMIRSFEEAKLTELWHPRLFAPAVTSAGVVADAVVQPARGILPPREFAEMVWHILNANILGFLAEIPAARQHRVRFEDLVEAPERTLRKLCGFLGIPFEQDMLDPHSNPRERMTDGIHPESRMIGDMKFHQHQKIDADAAGLWKRAYQTDFLSREGFKLAAALGYDETVAQAADREEFEI